jgi:hypothetical protein
VAERANAEAQFNAPPHQSELNGRSLPAQAISGNVADHLGFKACYLVKSAIQWVDLYRLYNQKASQHKLEIRRKRNSDEYFLFDKVPFLKFH